MTDADAIEDAALLNTDTLRVSPSTGVVHTAWCRTQRTTWGPVLALPWPKCADDEDRACKTCKPSLDLPELPRPH